MSPEPQLSQPVVSPAEAESAAKSWAKFELQKAQLKAQYEDQVESINQIQKGLANTIQVYAEQERKALFADRKSTTWGGLKIAFRKAQDSLQLKPGLSFEDIWVKVNSEKNQAKYPDLIQAIEPPSLHKKRLKDLSDATLKFLGITRIVGRDEFTLDLDGTR